MQGQLIRLDPSGHTVTEWDTEAPSGRLDPKYAEKEFNRLLAEGHLGYGTTAEGENIQLRKGEFDPETYPKVTMSRQLVGG